MGGAAPFSVARFAATPFPVPPCSGAPFPVAPFPSALVEHLDRAGHSLLVAHHEPEQLGVAEFAGDVASGEGEHGCLRSLRAAGVAELRPGRWVLLLVARDYLRAVAAVRSLRASGYAATLGPADARHLAAWNTRNQPTWVTPEQVVCFPWVDVGVGADGGRSLVFEIDPGAAFGAGNHPSTLLLLRWLAARATDGRVTHDHQTHGHQTYGRETHGHETHAPGLVGASVLDVGCGTGVLGLFAAALGAGRVVGIDIDPKAVAASRANAHRNGLASRATFSATPLAEVVRLGEPRDRFDVVVANIDAATLGSLAANLVAALATGGVFAVSGISPGQLSVTAAAFRAAGASVGQPTAGSPAALRLDDYCALVGSVPCM